ncbi:MAG: hypothetical protein DHS20C07_08200 [Methyloligella sp.]|nr:MAG: hypothetical protein DHS20C07_08200 [Methyloligella sp.]
MMSDETSNHELDEMKVANKALNSSESSVAVGGEQATSGHMAEVEAAASKDEFPPIPEDEIKRLTNDIIAAIKTVYDPEIPVDIYELGLIYKVDIENDRSVHVDMTLTTPGCPVAGEMPEWVVNAVVGVEGVKKAKVELTFDPPWDMSMMSEEARFALNMF